MPKQVPDLQRKVMLAMLTGVKHTMRDSVISALCRKDLIRVVETTPLGSAKRVEFTISGRLLAERWSNI